MTKLPQPLASLAALARAQAEDDQRQKLSSVSWFRDVFRISGSTLPRIWKPTLVITIWATIVAIADILYDQHWNLENQVIPLLSVVVGLLLVFRNSAAFARWESGRSTFATLMSQTRNLARVTFLHAGASNFSQERKGPNGESQPFQVETWSTTERDAKAQALRLMVAFVVASKHHVRAEYGLDHEDLNSLLPSDFADRYGDGYEIHESKQSRQASSPSEYTPLLDTSGSDMVIIQNTAKRPSLPLPLLIAHALQMYFLKAKAQGYLDAIGPAGWNNMTTSISSMVSTFTSMERLTSLPLPTCHGVHLKQTTTLYLLALPLVLQSTMEWRMIPFVTLVAFTLMGIEGIASEIESPFGHDASDLPLDLLTAELRNEIEHYIARLPETPSMRNTAHGATSALGNVGIQNGGDDDGGDE